jgi:hypothetical protein
MQWWKSGDKIRLDTNLQKSNPQIRIHSAYVAGFPAVLHKGALGEIVENNRGELFVRFMLKAPQHWEQEFMKDNVVYFTLPTSAAWMLKARD